MPNARTTSSWAGLPITTARTMGRVCTIQAFSCPAHSGGPLGSFRSTDVSSSHVVTDRP